MMAPKFVDIMVKGANKFQMENAPIGNVGFCVERSLGPTKPLMNAPLFFVIKIEPIKSCFVKS
ncbi:MAG: hypothetical protein DWQ04_25355 [Chloroflexi bacterium]|nr:MAG: hypothetical protein DWQ04_25355 [Chloroflexota bacterium]